MIRVFGHYLSRGILLLAVFEWALLFLAVYAGLHLYAQVQDVALEQSALWYLGIAVAPVIGALVVFGLYRLEGVGPLRRELIRIIGAIVIAGAGIGLLLWIDQGRALSAPAVWAGLGAASVTLLLFRVAVHEGRQAGMLQHRLLVLGTGSRAAKVDELLQPGVPGGAMVVGFLPMEESAPHDVPSHRILWGDIGCSLADVVARHGIQEIVVAIRDRRGKVPMRELLLCKLNGIRVIDVSTFFEREKGQLRLESLNAGWLIFADGFRRNGPRRAVKRLFDVGVSASLLVMTLPIILLAAAAVWLESGRPILFRQTRIGEGGQPFQVLKFRSMRQDAEADGQARWAAAEDDRITRVGGMLRHLRVDELPQVLNILRGEMSFVGPRPERPIFVDQLNSEIPFYNARHSIKPGLTGWAQVRYAYGASVEDAVEKLQYDLYYVKNHTLFLDLLILIDTVRVVLFGKGAR